MIPVVTPAEMAAIDAAAAEPLDRLVDRAGRAVARAALTMLGGSYGRRVAVVTGPGNNGADGAVAARHLERRGIRCRIFPVVEGLPHRLGGVDLVIDAAFGTGLARPFDFPSVDDGIGVLAVDIPSGVDGLTGARLGKPVRADRTITFAALKPGLLLEPGRSLAGDLELAEIGLPVSCPSGGLVVETDVANTLRSRRADHHKWRAAVRVIGGSQWMPGAASLAAAAAQRSGAGLVQLAVPGRTQASGPIEAVGHPLPAADWGPEATAGTERLSAVLVGPGLGTCARDSLADVLGVACPLIVDGDALQPSTLELVAQREGATILTPHGGEWQRIGGGDGPDQFEAVGRLAQELNAVVVRKGPTTLIGAPGRPVQVVAAGTAVLATAGTGDVLAGLILGLLARGMAPGDAAAAGAWIHAATGSAGVGAVASDLLAEIPRVLARIGVLKLGMLW